MAPSRMPPFRDTGCPLCAVVLAAQLLFAAAVPLQDQSRPAFGEDNGEEPVAGRLGTTASRPGGLKNMRWMHIPKAGEAFCLHARNCSGEDRSSWSAIAKRHGKESAVPCTIARIASNLPYFNLFCARYQLWYCNVPLCVPAAPR